MCLDLYVHWVSRSMHLTELKQSDWVISALIINEFEKDREKYVKNFISFCKFWHLKSPFEDSIVITKWKCDPDYCAFQETLKFKT